MERLFIVGIDVDNGMASKELDRIVRERGVFCIRYTTHSSGREVTEVSRDDLNRFLRESPEADVRDYLTTKKRFIPAIAETAEVIEEKQTGSGIVTRIKHAPMPKNRLVFILAQPWSVADYPTQAEALAAWRRSYLAFAAWLGIQVDEACTDVSRLYFTPRHSDGAPYEAVVHEGKAVDIFALPSVKTDASATSNPFLAAASAMGAKVEGSADDLMRKLKRWAATGYADTFLIADALEARSPDVLHPEKDRGDVHHIECPFQDEHTDPSAFGGSFVINAGESHKGGFVIGCQHNACTGRDRLDFLAEMIKRDWLTTEDLCADEFQIEVGGAEGRPTHGELFLGERTNVQPRESANLGDGTVFKHASNQNALSDAALADALLKDVAKLYRFNTDRREWMRFDANRLIWEFGASDHLRNDVTNGL
ncbi:hypothetical protein [Azospirillum thermophilum]|nr:hypothetical protein [Azospirillum thermophilum]